MVNALKEYAREELVRELQELESFVLVGYKGLNSEETLGLRQSVRGAQLQMRVVRNRITRIAFKELGIEGLDGELSGPSALISGSDPIELTKAVAGFQKDTKEKVVVKGGYIEGQVVSGEGVKRLAKTPPREVLLGMLVGAIQAPVAGVVNCIGSPVVNMVRLLGVIADKKQNEG